MERMRAFFPVDLWKSIVATKAATTASGSSERIAFSFRGLIATFAMTASVPFWMRVVVRMMTTKVAKTIRIAIRAISSDDGTSTGSLQTPRMVGTQAVLNVLSGERYKMVPKEINEYLHGRYGASPAPVNEEIRKKIIGDDKVITYRPADDLKPEFESLKKQYKGVAKSDEDVLSIALFGDVARKFLNQRNEDLKPTKIKVEA